MSTTLLLVSIVAVMCWVAHMENNNIPEDKKIDMMVEADLKAKRKRGDILSQGRRHYYG